MDNIQQLKQWIDGSDRIVFFGGAGVSTESGIPDFRSVDGLYNQKYDYPPETILSHSFFMAHPEEYYKFHRDKLVVDGAKPNRAHLRLAELEREGKLQAVITQNIDGLHQAAGSKNVLELHGSIHRCYCMRCGRPYPAERVNHGTGVPHCDCGGIIGRTSCFMRSAWTTMSCPGRSITSARRRCSSSAARRWPCTPRRDF